MSHLTNSLMPGRRGIKVVRIGVHFVVGGLLMRKRRLCRDAWMTAGGSYYLTA